MTPFQKVEDVCGHLCTTPLGNNSVIWHQLQSSDPDMQQINDSVSNSTSWTVTNNVVPCVLLGLCFLVGIPGNVLVAVAILRNLRQATVTVKLMLNLAVTDALSLLLLPFWIPALLGPWPYSPDFCKLLSYLVYCTMYASVLTITMMSMQRYMLVLYPRCKLKLHPRGSGVKALLGVLWTLALVLASPALLLRKLLPNEGRLRCQPLYSSDGQKVAVLLSETLLGFVVPGVILTISYLCIARRVGRLPFTSGKRLSRLVTWVMAAFFIFWFPSHVANLLQVAGFQDVAESIRNVAGALTFFNSCLNPFLYAFASPRLRGSSSLMKRLERVCHSKLGDTPPPDSRKPSLCTQAGNLTTLNQTPV
uniref:G-protein coupled receptors family 1 profile domain-containing protein n=1 Tax=Scleropages formosus TaxID=113540 RepID=A0A8C9RQX0_SCLFO